MINQTAPKHLFLLLFGILFLAFVKNSIAHKTVTPI
jgi:hypothetical protein